MADGNEITQGTNGNLPRIEVTAAEEDETTRTNDQQATTRNRGRRNKSSRCVWRMDKLASISRHGFLTFVPHIILGSAMVIVGYVSWEIMLGMPEKFCMSKNTNSTLSLMSLLHRARIPNNPMICTDIFSVFCIAFGGEIIFSGVSGYVLTRQKLREYVNCHILWISISALSASILLTSCAMGLREAVNITRGLTTCVYTAMAATAIEILFILNDLRTVTYHLARHHAQVRGSRRQQQVPPAGIAAQAPPENEVDIVNTQSSNGLQSAARHASSPNSRNQNRRAATGQGYHGRRRRSGQAVVRDRTHLYPGYHSNVGRNRLRRRPLLRAQNHYVCLPTAYGRPRTVSRGARNQTAPTQAPGNAREVPMFVIANHNRYVQELNQSMEHLKSGTNRGSVPGDAFPVIDSDPSHVMTKLPLRKSKSYHVTTTCSLNGREAMPSPRNTSVVRNDGKHIPNQQDVDSRPAVVDELSTRRKNRDQNGYSIVMKTRQAPGPKRALKNVRSVDDHIPLRQAHRDLQLRSEFSINKDLGIDAVEDAVFPYPSANERLMHNSPLSHPQSRIFNTKSESDFKHLSTRSKPGRDGSNSCLASVSSDSGICDGISGIVTQTETGRSHVRAHSERRRRNIETIPMNEFGVQEMRFSPVSNTTPSYENMTDTADDTPNRFQF